MCARCYASGCIDAPGDFDACDCGCHYGEKPNPQPEKVAPKPTKRATTKKRV